MISLDVFRNTVTGISVGLVVLASFHLYSRYHLDDLARCLHAHPGRHTRAVADAERLLNEKSFNGGHARRIPTMHEQHGECCPEALSFRINKPAALRFAFSSVQHTSGNQIILSHSGGRVVQAGYLDGQNSRIWRICLGGCPRGTANICQVYVKTGQAGHLSSFIHGLAQFRVCLFHAPG